MQITINNTANQNDQTHPHITKQQDEISKSANQLQHMNAWFGVYDAELAESAYHSVKPKIPFTNRNSDLVPKPLITVWGPIFNSGLLKRIADVLVPKTP